MGMASPKTRYRRVFCCPRCRDQSCIVRRSRMHPRVPDSAFDLTQNEVRTAHARLSLPHHHPRPQHGRRPRPVARHRHEERGLRQADHRRGQFVHPVRARPCPSARISANWWRARSRRAGGVAKEFNTIAVDDGIAMGHDGMLYSLPSRELIADSVEYMVNAHCADAMVCISNCDKITPGHADGGDAPQHPDRVRLRRPDGGRQGHASRARPGRST